MGRGRDHPTFPVVRGGGGWGVQAIGMGRLSFAFFLVSSTVTRARFGLVVKAYSLPAFASRESRTVVLEGGGGSKDDPDKRHARITALSLSRKSRGEGTRLINDGRCESEAGWLITESANQEND